MICVEISQAHNQILSDMYWRTYIEPPVRNHPKLQRLSGRLREVVVYEN